MDNGQFKKKKRINSKTLLVFCSRGITATDGRERKESEEDKQTDREGEEETESSQRRQREKALQDADSHVYGYEQPKHNPSLTWLNAFSISLTNHLYMLDIAKLAFPILSLFHFFPPTAGLPSD